MTTRVVSFFTSGNAHASLENHRRYCASRSYTHEFVDASGIGWTHLRTLLKYQAMLRTLRAMQEGELMLVLTQDCLIVRDMACEALMEGESRDQLIGSMGDAASDAVLGAFQLWRNTAASRELMQRICEAARFSKVTARDESELLRMSAPRHYMSMVNGVHPVVVAGWHIDPIWTGWPVFAVLMVDLPDAPFNQPVHAGFRDLLAHHVNECQAKAEPYLNLPAQGESAHAYETLNPHASIALAMLYTPNIRGYGAIAERNLRRYCARHGYAFHVYRDVPDRPDENGAARASGNWLKPWVLRRHLPQHEWTIWVDADVLVLNQSIPLEALLANRDRLISMDMSWQFNSGIMGFRNTQANAEVLREVDETIAGLADRSSTYASGGDQDAFIRVLNAHGMASAEELLDCTTLNTPYQLHDAASFMVHYMHMWPALRTLAMQHGDTASAVLDSRRR